MNVLGEACLPLMLQLIVVVSADWNAVDGTLYCYQRSNAAHSWELFELPIPVALGKHGMAWGRGLYDLTDQPGLHKEEGDGRSPAGLFSLGTVFGDASHQIHAKNMPFLFVTDDLECIDDPHSKYYNQFVTASSIVSPDWNSSEKMMEIGSLYALGLVVEHNLNPIKSGMGSAIFMHIWRGKGIGTHGCTVMQEKDLNRIVSWLRKEQHPCLVQLPIEIYKNRQSQWNMPEIP